MSSYFPFTFCFLSLLFLLHSSLHLLHLIPFIYLGLHPPSKPTSPLPKPTINLFAPLHHCWSILVRSFSFLFYLLFFPLSPPTLLILLIPISPFPFPSRPLSPPFHFIAVFLSLLFPSSSPLSKPLLFPSSLSNVFSLFFLSPATKLRIGFV